MLCLVGSVDPVEETLVELCSLLGFKLNSLLDGVKVEPTLADVKETFEEESYSKNEEDASDFGGDKLTLVDQEE